MPYTFSHIGYILPIKNRYQESFSATGLVFGSIAPDFDILFRFTNIRMHIFQYSFFEIILMIYPISLISAYFFHLICRDILIENLPDYFRIRLQHCYGYSFTYKLKHNFIKVSASVFFAIILHLVLDFAGHIINAYYVQLLISFFTKNKIILNLSYLIAIYGLPILLSSLGMILLYKHVPLQHLSRYDFMITKNQLLFWSILGLTSITLLLVKLIMINIENDFMFDYVIISFTSSVIIGTYINCTILKIFRIIT